MITAVRRLGFATLGALNLVWGAWAVAAPERFFNGFPGFGYAWTAAYPPYNEHLVVDLGATFVLLGMLLAGAAIADRRAVSWLVGAGVGGFGLLHLAYHALHAGQMTGADRPLSLVTLVGGAFVPPLLAATHHLRRAG